MLWAFAPGMFVATAGGSDPLGVLGPMTLVIGIALLAAGLQSAWASVDVASGFGSFFVIAWAVERRPSLGIAAVPASIGAALTYSVYLWHVDLLEGDPIGAARPHRRRGHRESGVPPRRATVHPARPDPCSSSATRTREHPQHARSSSGLPPRTPSTSRLGWRGATCLGTFGGLPVGTGVPHWTPMPEESDPGTARRRRSCPRSTRPARSVASWTRCRATDGSRPSSSTTVRRDGTGDEARAHGAAVVVSHDQRQGVGAAIRDGWKEGVGSRPAVPRAPLGR